MNRANGMGWSEPASTGVAITKALLRSLELVSEVQRRPASVSRWITIGASAGTGKTFSLAYVETRSRAGGTGALPIRLAAEPGMSKARLVQVFCRAAGLPESDCRTAGRGIDALIDELRATPRLLLVDEVQELVGRVAFDVLRMIVEASGAPIVTCGDEQLERMLGCSPRLSTRMTFHKLPEADIADARALAAVHGGGVHFADRLLERLLRDGRMNTRRLCVAIDDYAARARLEGLDGVDVDTFDSVVAVSTPAHRARAKTA